MSRFAVALVRLAASPVVPASDAHLLRTFVAAQGEDAFAELVRRHGPMVLAVCRRALSDAHDAEDAFQAVFLVLARKAGTVRGTNVAAWLYGVAVRTARGVRVMRDRRRKHERASGGFQPPDTATIADHDTAAVIDEELAKLPDCYRDAVVLCELRGLSRKQAAAELGVPEGTLSSRLAAAKRKLAGRLAARGLAGAALVAALSPAVVSAALLESTALAVRGAAGGVASAAASAVLKGMLFDQLKAVVLSAAVCLTAVCGGLAMTGAHSDAPPGKAVAPAPRAVDDPTAKLVKQLGSADFAAREAAHAALRKLGPKAEPALKAGLKSDDPEVRARAAKLLTEIRADALDALAKTFDPVAENPSDHPIWKRFKAIAGDSRASRDLFARIIANKKWLRTLDNAEADPAAAGHVYRVGIAEMFRDFDKDPAKSPPWPCDRPEEVAYLLLLGSYPDNNPPAKLTGDEICPTSLRNTDFLGRGIIHGEGQITHANGLSLGLDGKIRFFNAPEIVGAAGTDRVFAKLFAAWLARRDPSSEVVPRGFRIAAGLPEVLPLARHYAANDFEPKREVPPNATIAALELVAQLGTKADLPLFERHFGDKTNVAAVDKPRADGARDYYRPAPVTDTTQLRDVALGLALLLHGASPEDFGFVVRKDTFTQKDGRYAIPWSTQLHLGFDSEASRTAAFKKAKTFFDKQPKAEPKKEEPKPEPTAAKLVEQLGGDDFAAREAAEKELRKLGPKAEGALKAGLKADDPEVRARAAVLLAEIRKDALDALVKTFDPVAENPSDHPIWKRFKAIAGDTRASRDLFALVIKNANWLRRLDAAEAGPEAAAQQYRDAILDVGRHFRGNLSVGFIIYVWPCDTANQAAFLMLLGSYPGTEAAKPKDAADAQLFTDGEGRIHFARGLQLGLQGKLLDRSGGFRPDVVKATAGTDRVFAKLLAAWLAHRTDENVLYGGFQLAINHRAADVLLVARVIAADKERGAGARAALPAVAQFGAPADLPLFTPHFDDTTVVILAPPPTANSPGPRSRRLRVDDGAIALALLLCDQDPFEYGFVYSKDRFRRENGRPVIANYEAEGFGFSDEKARAAAHAKAKAFLDKRDVAPPPRPKP